MGNKPVYSKMTTSLKSIEASLVTAGGVAIEAAIQKFLPLLSGSFPPGFFAATVAGTYYAGKNWLKHRNKGKA